MRDEMPPRRQAGQREGRGGDREVVASARSLQGSTQGWHEPAEELSTGTQGDQGRAWEPRVSPRAKACKCR
jgi:hypothetical protein